MSGRTLRRRRWIVASVAAVLVVVAVAGGVLAWQAATERARISTEELRRLPTIALTWSEPQLTPASAKADLYVVRADQTEPRLLRRWPGELGGGRVYGASGVWWSPDRRQIALTLGLCCGDTHFQVGIVSADGRRLRKLSGPLVDVGALAWSPDGRRLLYSSCGDGELRIVSPDGGNTARLRMSVDPEPCASAEWSPDGRQIVVATKRGVATLARDGSTLLRLTDAPDDMAPTWSPDGRSIAFIRGQGCFGELVAECSDPANVWVIGADGKGLRQLTRRAGATSLLWSPDGEAIAFTDEGLTSDDEGGVGLVPLSGGAEHLLVRGGYPAVIAWSPDGRTILFDRQVSDDRWPRTTWLELWVMDADGRRPTRLPFNRPRRSVESAHLG